MFGEGKWDPNMHELVYPNPMNNIAPFQESGQRSVSNTITVNLAEYGYQVGWGMSLNVRLTATAQNGVSHTSFVTAVIEYGGAG
jgi:hypothetical protein